MGTENYLLWRTRKLSCIIFNSLICKVVHAIAFLRVGYNSFKMLSLDSMRLSRLSNATSPVITFSFWYNLVCIAWPPPPPRSMAFGWDPSKCRVNTRFIRILGCNAFVYLSFFHWLRVKCSDSFDSGSGQNVPALMTSALHPTALVLLDFHSFSPIFPSCLYSLFIAVPPCMSLSLCLIPFRCKW